MNHQKSVQIGWLNIALQLLRVYRPLVFLLLYIVIPAPLAVGQTATPTPSLQEIQLAEVQESDLWWERFILPFILPYGWLAAALAMVLFWLLQKFADKIIEKPLDKGASWLYRQWAWMSPSSRKKLKRYRAELVKNYSMVKIPFHREYHIPIKKIYVPLMFKNSPYGSRVDAFEEINRYKRLMVVGKPGSGKSTLMRRYALGYALGGPGILNEFIPILLELKEFNGSVKTIQELLVDILAKNEFKEAGDFVQYGLEHDKFIFLFDGLDEVDSDKRENVINQIMQFAEMHRNCGLVISCRTDIYKGQFDQKTVKQVLELDDFTEYEIENFLSTWEWLPKDKPVEQLMRALGERPQIMQLVRNPLLLTILALLHSDENFLLPNSRTEFYAQATILLLADWKEEHWGKEEGAGPAERRALLKYLALAIHSRSNLSAQGSGRIGLADLMKQVQSKMATLGIEAGKIRPLIDEIVRRSGLLRAIDRGNQYEFAHRTFQEFFVADALEENSNELLKYFRNDASVWGEVVKLWCGFAHDSTHVIQSIYESTPITALECLGDAQQVDTDFAKQIVRSFHSRLAEEGDSGEAIRRAFATIAASQKPHGEALTSFLETVLRTDEVRERRIAAATVLSLTHLPKAAQVLGEHNWQNEVEIRNALIRMGDVAVPVLLRFLEADPLKVLTSLLAVRTPHAIERVIAQLWSSNLYVACSSAWCLAAFLSKSGADRRIDLYSPTSEQRRAQRFSWIWEPFESSSESNMSVVAGRIAFLLSISSDTALPNEQYLLDPRIAIPTCSILLKEDMKAFVERGKAVSTSRLFTRSKRIFEFESLDAPEPIVYRLRSNRLQEDLTRYTVSTDAQSTDAQSLSDVVPPSLSVDVSGSLLPTKDFNSDTEQVIRALHGLDDLSPIKGGEHVRHSASASVVSQTSSRVLNSREQEEIEDLKIILNLLNGSDRTWKYLIQGLQDKTQRKLLERMLTEREPTVDDWRNIVNPSTYLFSKSWHSRVIRWTMGIVTLFSLGQALVFLRQPPGFVTWIDISLVLSAYFLLISWLCLFDNLHNTVDWLGQLLGERLQRLQKMLNAFAEVVLLISFSESTQLLHLFICTITAFYINFFFLSSWLSWPYILLFYCGFMGIGTSLWIVGKRKERVTRNPLRGLLPLPAGAAR